MREKRVRKRGRKQRALWCLLWIVILLLGNSLFHVIPMFRFQARDNLEIQYGLGQTHVVWEETADRGRWDGKLHCLSADDTTAIFYNLHYIPLFGWEGSVIQLLNKNTTEIMDASWSNYYSRDYHPTIWVMGYVASDQVACVEYSFIWDDEVVETYRIPEEAYVWDGEDRYYVYDTRDCLSADDPVYGNPYGYVSDVIVVARDAEGEILYQKKLYPRW